VGLDHADRCPASSRLPYQQPTIIIIIVTFFTRGKSLVAQKITKENYETCLEVNPTLAGRHQRNHHAAKPN